MNELRVCPTLLLWACNRNIGSIDEVYHRLRSAEATNILVGFRLLCELSDELAILLGGLRFRLQGFVDGASLQDPHGADSLSVENNRRGFRSSRHAEDHNRKSGYAESVLEKASGTGGSNHGHLGPQIQALRGSRSAQVWFTSCSSRWRTKLRISAWEKTRFRTWHGERLPVGRPSVGVAVVADILLKRYKSGASSPLGAATSLGRASARECRWL